MLYVTGNTHKFADAVKLLGEYGIELEQKVLKLQEIQSDSIEEVALDKAKQAYEELKQPLFVNDAGWYFTKLKGFPGPFMAYVNNWLSAEDFLRLLKPYEGSEVLLKQVNVFIDEDGPQVFVYENVGKVLGEVRGEGRSVDCIVSFLDNGLSIAEAKAQGIISVGEEGLWDQMGTWLKENNKI